MRVAIAYLLVLLFVLACLFVYRQCRGRSQHRREHFVSQSIGVSLFDLREFSHFPTSLNETLRVAVASLLASLGTKMNELYTKNPDFINANIQQLLDVGLNGINLLTVPPVVTPVKPPPNIAQSGAMPPPPDSMMSTTDPSAVPAATHG